MNYVEVIKSLYLSIPFHIHHQILMSAIEGIYVVQTRHVSILMDHTNASVRVAIRR